MPPGSAAEPEAAPHTHLNLLLEIHRVLLVLLATWLQGLRFGLHRGGWPGCATEQRLQQQGEQNAGSPQQHLDSWCNCCSALA